MAGEVTQEALLAPLRSVSCPGTGRDVAQGSVREVSFAPTPLDAETVRQMMEGIRQEPSRVVPQADEIGATLRRVGVAPDLGYGEGGPDPLPSPESIAPEDRYTGWPPVFQWEMDPADPSLETGEVSVRLGDWEYEVWSQVHPAGLVYVSIQAMHDDPAAGPERQHPLGRNVVVNLVYDRRRAGVVAIYGTARDFRPFIEAFRIGCGLDDERRQEGKGESS